MFRRYRPGLILPIHDRRQHIRIVTLKNFAWMLIVLVVAIFAVEGVSHFHAVSASDDYGRLYNRHIGDDTVVATRAPAVVTEAPVPDETSADPLLVSAAARSQYLGTPTLPNAAASTQVLCPPSDPGCTAATATQPGTRSANVAATTVPPGGHVAIVGDSNGVAVVAPTKSTTPKLTGGIFR